METFAAPAALVLLVAAGWIALVAAAALAQRLITFPWWLDRRTAVPAAALAEAGIEEISLATADGQTLRALWKAPEAGSPLIVTFHGIRGWHWTNALRFASGRWKQRGFGVLAVSFRGYHGSTGWPSEPGFMIDSEAAVSEARRRAPGAPNWFHGHSLGSAVAVAASARFGCKVLLLESPFTALPEVGARWYPILPVRRLMRDMFPTARLIRWVKADRVIVLHGTEDRFIPEWMGKSVVEASGGRAIYLPLAGQGHTGLQASSDLALGPVLFPEDAAAAEAAPGKA